MRRVLLFLLAFSLFALPAVAAEAPAPLPWLDEAAAVAVGCGRTSVDLAVVNSVQEEPIPQDPVNTSDKNCICPHPGAGWVMLFDSCLYDPRTALCSGKCYWDNPVRMMGTTTPCGSP